EGLQQGRDTVEYPSLWTRSLRLEVFDHVHAQARRRLGIETRDGITGGSRSRPFAQVMECGDAVVPGTRILDATLQFALEHFGLALIPCARDNKCSRERRRGACKIGFRHANLASTPARIAYLSHQGFRRTPCLRQSARDFRIAAAAPPEIAHDLQLEFTHVVDQLRPSQCLS